MALHRLVDDIDRLRAAWEHEPLHSTGLGGFDGVSGIDLVDHLITARGLRIPYLRMLEEGAYLPPSRFTHRTGTGSGQADGVAGPHYDPMSVLIRRAHEIKHWRLQGRPDGWAHGRPAAMLA